MLSENFKTLLRIEEERLVAMRADCAPFAVGDGKAAQVHQRAIDDMDRVLELTRAFHNANPATGREKREALQRYGQASKTTMALSSFMFSNSHCAGPFRNAALQKHAALLNTIAREQVLTCVNTGWELISEICGAVDITETQPKPPAGGAKIIPLTPRRS